MLYLRLLADQIMPHCLPRSYCISGCCRSRACYELGCKPFLDALTTHLHSLTGMKPSVVQKDMPGNCDGLLQWVVEPLDMC
jgi:hypothetical protein